jgi:hypothetical protein
LSRRIRRFVALVIRLWRGSRFENDLRRDPLPLYLRSSVPDGERASLPHATTCAACGVVYLPRPRGSVVPEDGRCDRCAGVDRDQRLVVEARKFTGPGTVAKITVTRRRR